jgi:subtilisin family serine protease
MKIKWILAAASVGLGLSVLGAQGTSPESWTFLSTTTIGARDFRQAHPEWDGRGVLIAVCDSGVDLGLPGLTLTSDGQPKILDARVFIENRKVKLEKAEWGEDEHGKAVHGKNGKWLYGLGEAGAKVPAGQDLWVGYFREKDLQNSDAENGDLNGDGDTNDVYGIVVFKAEDGRWTALLDTDGDGSLAGEKPLHDFAEGHETFALGGRDLHGQAPVMGFALNLWPDEKKAALYMADGSHGTHVAGIAAGFRIDGKDGFDGIAPGAQILALKIGDNTLSGGATTPGSMVSAWRYAVKKAEELGMPLVIQMSYGVGSEIEGTAEAERLLDSLLEDHPGVVATVSAGNEGPGISTVGLPACMEQCLAVAAVLNRDSAKDLYGADLAQNEIFSFSSRGAEMDKPDIACPGFALSTVPNYEKGRAVFRGTSMASPQAAGAAALLLSAARAQHLPIRRDLVKAALQRSATAIPGYGPLDYGAGLVNVPAAWKVYDALARGNERVLGFRAETESPERPSRKGPAVHWRGSYYPASDRPQTVTVRPAFPPDLSAEAKARFFAAFDLEAVGGFFRVDRTSVFMKAEEPARFAVVFDPARLKTPGLYQGEVRAFPKGQGRDLGPAWRVPVSVAVPEPFSDGALRRRVENLAPAKVARMYLRIPANSAGLAVRLEAPAGQKGAAAATLFDPEGRQVAYGLLRPEARKADLTVPSSRLEPGVYELTVYAAYANTQPVSLEVNAVTVPLLKPLAEKVSLKTAQGKTPTAELEVFPALDSVLRGNGSGHIVGTLTERTQKVSGTEWERTFSLAPGEASAEFRLSLSPEDYGKFTDIAVQILDADGKALASDGFSYRFAEIALRKPGKPGEKYTLKVRAAAADPEGEPSWSLQVEELHRFAEPVTLNVTQGKEKNLVLYPDRRTALTLEAASVPPALPDGALYLATVTVQDAEREALRLPLEIRLGP